MTTKIAVLLGTKDMDRLVAAFHDDPVQGFVDMWHTVEPEFDTMETVVPGDYQLTREQSNVLTAAGLEGCRLNDIDTWVIMGLWLNKGPSTSET